MLSLFRSMFSVSLRLRALCIPVGYTNAGSSLLFLFKTMSPSTCASDETHSVESSRVESRGKNTILVLYSSVECTVRCAALVQCTVYSDSPKGGALPEKRLVDAR